MLKPNPAEFGYFERYIVQVPESDLKEAFANQWAGMTGFLNSISEEKSAYAYAPGKWTIKELLQHIIDTERVFTYRALCFARGEKANLPGFEEDDYAAASMANQRSWQSLVNEMLALRKATEMLFNSFDEAVLNNSGTASNNHLTPLAIGFVTVGHYNHHVKILKERYL